VKVSPWSFPAAIASAVDKLGCRRMNALFERPADFAVPRGVVFVGVETFFFGADFVAPFFRLAAFLATFFGFVVAFGAAITPLTLYTLLSEVS
jgi:hypothetical protein